MRQWIGMEMSLFAIVSLIDKKKLFKDVILKNYVFLLIFFLFQGLVAYALQTLSINYPMIQVIVRNTFCVPWGSEFIWCVLLGKHLIENFWFVKRVTSVLIHRVVKQRIIIINVKVIYCQLSIIYCNVKQIKISFVISNFECKQKITNVHKYMYDRLSLMFE